MSLVEISTYTTTSTPKSIQSPSQPGKFRGRFTCSNPLFNPKAMLAIGLLGSLFLGRTASAYSTTSENTYSSQEPFRFSSQNQTDDREATLQHLEALEHPLSKDADLLARHMYAGYQSVDGGKAACVMNQSQIKHATECARDVQVLYRLLGGQIPYAAHLAAERGYPLTLQKPDGSLDRYSVSIDPAQRSSFRNAIFVTEQEIVQKSGFFEMSTQAIVDVFAKIHAALGAHDESMAPGKFRDGCGIILHNTTSAGSTVADTLRVQLRDKGISEDKIEPAITAIVEKHPICDYPESIRETLNHIATVMPHPSHICGGLTRIIDNLKSNVNMGESPNYIAALAHQPIAKLMPFQDGNGRFLMLFVNAIRAMYGKDNIIFPDEDSYHAVTATGQIEPFVQYLDNLEGWMQQAKPILSS